MSTPLNPITQLREQPGYRLLDGSDINQIIDSINQSGQSWSNSSVINYLSYNPSAFGNLGTDLTTSLQNFLLQCQILARRLKSLSLDDQVQRSCVNAYFPRARYTITSPLIVPEYVNLISDGIIVRTGQAGTITNFYTGDTRSRALVNLWQPAVIVPPRSHLQKCSVYCNSNGLDRGSGVAVGKNWEFGDPAFGGPTPIIFKRGFGYEVGDLLTFYQPSVSPYISGKMQVTTTNGTGGITGLLVTEPGAYGLPPVLQRQQWTVANGFTGAFDEWGNLSFTGGSGTGASITPQWQPDFSSGTGKSYYSGRGGIISDYIIDHLYVVQSERTFDNVTYGPKFGVSFYGLNGKIGEIEEEGAFDGIRLNSCNDMHITKLNPVNSERAIYMNRCGNSLCSQVVIDSPRGNTAGLLIDHCTNINLKGTIFNHDLANLDQAYGGIIQLGGQSTSTEFNNNIQLDFILSDAGCGGDINHLISIGGPVALIAQTRYFDFNFTVANNAVGFSGTYSQLTTMANFGANVSSGRIKGSIDQTFRTLYAGTLPSTVDLDIADGDVSITNSTITATITGTATQDDVISITFANDFITASFRYPVTVTYTVQSTDSTTDIAVGIKNAINTNAVLSLTAVRASSSTNVVTIIQKGSVANSTDVTSDVSGSATEIVTISNSGNMSGGVSGGRLSTNGIYRLAGSSAPTNGTIGTGWGVAIAGSEYTNLTNGDFYKNTNTSASPTWALV